MPLSKAPADVGAVCREVVGELRAAHPMQLLRFEPQGDLAGEWDAARLRQLVSNLLGNAVQHGDGSPVELTVGAEGPQVVLAVHNEGTPIPPDAMPTIFNPLARGFSPELRKHRPGSIGLGLYIAREVVIAHGGSIDVRSSAEDGTVFTVRLPRRAATH
jgi:signal transduction histidine kinase